MSDFPASEELIRYDFPDWYYDQSDYSDFDGEYEDRIDRSTRPKKLTKKHAKKSGHKNDAKIVARAGAPLDQKNAPVPEFYSDLVPIQNVEYSMNKKGRWNAMETFQSCKGIESLQQPYVKVSVLEKVERTPMREFLVRNPSIKPICHPVSNVQLFCNYADYLRATTPRKCDLAAAYHTVVAGNALSRYAKKRFHHTAPAHAHDLMDLRSVYAWEDENQEMWDERPVHLTYEIVTLAENGHGKHSEKPKGLKKSRSNVQKLKHRAPVMHQEATKFTLEEFQSLEQDLLHVSEVAQLQRAIDENFHINAQGVHESPKITLGDFLGPGNLKRAPLKRKRQKSSGSSVGSAEWEVVDTVLDTVVDSDWVMC